MDDLFTMDKTVKERLIGAAVLLALGVIFIPWILDGSPTKIKDSANLQLPLPNGTATHELNFKDGNVTKIDLPVPATVTEPATNDKIAESTKPAPQSKPSDPTKTSANTNTDTKTSTAKAVIPPKTNHIDRTKEAGTAASTDTSGTDTSGSDTSGSDTPKTDTSDAGTPDNNSEIERVAGDPRSAWVVQVGSFSHKNNAEKEVAALKAKGFPAFMSRYVSPEKKVLYRVRVGPEKERAQAAELKERLLKSDITGQIVAHP